MYSPYNLNPQQLTMNDLFTPDLYKITQMRIAKMMKLNGLPFFMHFCTSVRSTQFEAAPTMPVPVINGMVTKGQTNFKVENPSSNESPCMFIYRDFSGVFWDKRICGSTDNHLSRPQERIRGYMGDPLQTRVLLNSMCCNTEYNNMDIRGMIDGITTNLIESLSSLIVDKIIKSIFAPVTQMQNGIAKTVTFNDDTTEIDLTGTVSLQTVIAKLGSTVNTLAAPTEFYWFVPRDYYGVFVGLRANVACCSLLDNAVLNINSAPMVVPDGMQLSPLSYIKIFPLPKEYFPVNGAGKIVTALIPKGSIAWTMKTLPMLNLPTTGGAEPIDLMSLSQQRFESEYTDFLGQSALRLLLSHPQPSLNYNAELAAFTSIVTGRLPASAMYRILVEATPASA